MLSEDILMTVDPDSGDYEMASERATTLTGGGEYAVEIGETSIADTKVRVIDTDGFTVKQDVVVEGTVSNFAAYEGNSIILMRSDGPTGFATNTELVSLNLGDGTVASLGWVGARLVGENTVTNQDALFTEDNGTIAMFALEDAARLSLLPVQSAVRAWNGLGVNADGSTLVVASETTKAVMRIPVLPDAWVSMACSSAGRDTLRSDLDGIVSTVDGLIAGCGDGFTG